MTKTLPPSIKNSELNWLYKPIWHRPHNKNKMFSCTAIAEPGSGKSWLTLSMAHALDRNTDDVPRFDLDRIYFSAKDFSEGVSKKFPIGSCLIFDDAGLNLFSREAMQKNVRQVAKIFQSMRYKRYIVFLSLPVLSMLDKAVRQLISAYVQPLNIDYATSRTEAIFRWMQTNPMSGVIYLHKPSMYVKREHAFLDYSYCEYRTIDTIHFPAPPKNMGKAYDKLKKDYMDDWNRRTAESMKENKKTNTYEHFFEIVSKDPEAYRDSNEDDLLVIDPAEILHKHHDCGFHTARAVAKILNRRNGVRRQGTKWVARVMNK